MPPSIKYREPGADGVGASKHPPDADLHPSLVELARLLGRRCAQKHFPSITSTKEAANDALGRGPG